MKRFTKLSLILALSVIFLITGCSSSDSWPETLYLDRLFVGGSEVSAAPGSPFNYIYKTSDEQVYNSITFQQDDELRLPVLAGKTYEATWFFRTFGASSSDIRFYLAYTPGAEMNVGGYASYESFDTGIASLYSMYQMNGSNTDELYAQVHDTFYHSVTIKTTIRSSNDNTVSLWWAQKSAMSHYTKVLQGSFIEWRIME